MDSLSNHFILVGDDDDQVWNHFRTTLKPSNEQSSTTFKNLELILNTKYYSTNLRMMSFENLRSLIIWRTQNKDVSCQSFCLTFKKSQTAFDLSLLDTLMQVFDFDTKVIACYQSALPPTFLNTLTFWANKRGFEIIDLSPDESDIEYFKSNNERYSLDRLVEVLEGTEWNGKTQKKQDFTASKHEKVEQSNDESSDDDFSVDFDESVKDFLNELIAGPSIIDYLIGRGMDLKSVDGELSRIEEQEQNDKSTGQKTEKKTQEKNLKKEGDVSDDVGIELDESPPQTGQNTGDRQTAGINLIAHLKDLRRGFVDKPLEDRLNMAEAVTTKLYQLLDEDEDIKK